VFTLDTSKKWHDGTSIKSRDITYNFKDTVVEYPSDSTIVIKLTNAFSPLPVVVSRPVFKRGLVGAGNYKVAQIKKNGQIIESLSLVPVDSKSQLPKLKYLFYASENQARTAFALGSVRKLEEVSQVGEMLTWPNIHVEPTVRKDRYVGVFFNTQDPNLQGSDGKNLRLALAYALDKKHWENRAIGPVNPYSWAFNDDVKPYELDLVHAKDLFSKVGKKPKNLTISTIPTYLSVAEVVKSDWEKLGLKVDLQVTPEVPHNFSILIIAQAIPVDPDQYNLWHSTQADTNLTKLSNPRIDKLLEDGRKVQVQKERLKIYTDFQKYLVEEVPVIFLYHPTTYTLSRN
jgi:peptide/nickel transport system substrate-binding protein